MTYLAIGLLIFCGTLSAQEKKASAPDTVKTAEGIRVETSVDKSEIYIGDLINYRLTIYHDTDVALTPPPIGANLGAFDVKDYHSDDPDTLKDGRIKLESRFALTTFTTGDYIIPPIPIKYTSPDSTTRVLVSEPISIRVKSLLGEEATDTLDIRDLKPQYQFAESDWWLWGSIIGVVLLAAVVAFVIWRRKHRGEEKAEPVDLRDPWEIAFERLALLKEKDYLDNREYKIYYVELSDIFRAYVGRMYDIAAMDMTTDEFLYELEDIEMEPALYGRIAKFLKFADLIKFAKFVPDESRPMFEYDEVHEMVEYIREIEMTKRSRIEQIAKNPSKEEAGV